MTASRCSILSRSFTASEEGKRRDAFLEDEIKSYRKAAEVHREARSYIQSKIKPGMKLYDICCDLEDHIRHIIRENGPNAGMGFPTGCSLNHCAALHAEPWRRHDPEAGRCDEVRLRHGGERCAFSHALMNRIHHRLRVHGRLRPSVR